PDATKRPTAPDVFERFQSNFERLAAAQTGEQPFVGRHSELATLGEAWNHARQGAAVLQFLSGSAGMGKSSLLQRFLKSISAGQAGPLVLAGRCYEREMIPFKALDGIIRDLIRVARRLSKDELAASLPAGFDKLVCLFPSLTQFGRSETRRFPAEHDAESRLFLKQGFEALWQWIERLSGGRGVVLAFDDLQWGDLDSVSYLRWLIGQRNPVGLLVIVSHRGDELTAPIDALSTIQTGRRSSAVVRQLQLAPLDGVDSRSLLEQWSAELPNCVSIDDIIAECGGNPYHLQEVAQSFAAGTPAAQSFVLSFDNLLWRRVMQLPENCRTLLELISVAGRPTGRRDLSNVLSDNFPPRSDVLHLIHSGLLRSLIDDDGSEQYVPFHDRVRETVVGRLSREQCRERHEQLAEGLACRGAAAADRLAVHFEASGDLARAAEFTRIAADQAFDNLAFDQAAMLYRKLFDLWPTAASEEFSLRLRLGDCLAGAGQSFEAAQTFLDLVEHAAANQVILLWQKAGEQLLRSGRLVDGLEIVRRTLREQGIRLPSSNRAVAIASILVKRVHLRLRGYNFRLRPTAEIPEIELSLVDTYQMTAGLLWGHDMLLTGDLGLRGSLAALACGDGRRVALGLAQDVAVAAMRGARGRARKLLLQLNRLQRRIRDPYIAGMQRIAGHSTYYLFVGDWRRALRFASDALARLSRQPMCRAETTQAIHFRTWAQWNYGDLPGLLACAEQGAAPGADYDDVHHVLGSCNGFAAMSWLAADEAERAADQLYYAERIIAKRPFDAYRMFWVIAQAHIDLYRGRNEQALELLDREWVSIRKSGFLRIPLTGFEMRQLRARCELAVGGVANLRRAADDARELARTRIRGAPPMAHAMRASIAWQNRDDALARSSLVKARDGFRRAEMRVFAATADNRL
ncbi:MAG TPA: AAA family ATPase, partial [Pirellulales bacterium]